MGISVTHAVCLAAFHSLVHGAFAIFLINTSYYCNYKPEINHSTTAMNALLIAVGVLSLAVLAFRMPFLLKLVGFLYFLAALAVIASGIAYAYHYFNFYANSVFDKLIFYTDIECWVGPDYAMTVWHAFAVGLPVLAGLWLGYAALLCKLAPKVCCLPCPPSSCYKPPPQPQCCDKSKKKKCCPPACPPPCPPPCSPPCPPACPPPCSPCPPPCPPPCSPCPKKAPKFVLTLRPGKMSCK